jgi:hypothetical protein
VKSTNESAYLRFSITLLGGRGVKTSSNWKRASEVILSFRFFRITLKWVSDYFKYLQLSFIVFELVSVYSQSKINMKLGKYDKTRFFSILKLSEISAKMQTSDSKMLQPSWRSQTLEEVAEFLDD